MFGQKGFLNEIVWQRSTAHNMRTKGFVRVNDTLLLYVRSSAAAFNEQYCDYSEQQMRRYRPDANGRLYKAENLTFSTASPARQFDWRGAKPPANRSWGADLEQLEDWFHAGRILLKKDGTPRLDGLKIYLDETKGTPVTTNWTDIARIGNTAAERLGYPTQKPEALLERILKASSNEGDLVLDPFCGCGTTIAVAERLNRRWIGIDITHLAVALMKVRLKDTFGDDLHPYEVHGEPTDLEGARALFEEDRYQFQYWALGLVDARPTGEQKKGADKGIDGLKYFFVDESGKPEKVVLQVKGGHVNRGVIATLKGDMEREGAAISALITLEPPTRPMIEEAAEKGFYTDPLTDKQYEKVQILTIEDLLSGHKRLEYPPHLDATFLKAKRAKSDTGQGKLEI